MTAKTDEQIARDAARARVRRSAKRLARAQETVDAALAERRDAFAAAQDAGLSLRVIGDIAGISPEAVAKTMKASQPA